MALGREFLFPSNREAFDSDLSCEYDISRKAWCGVWQDLRQFTSGNGFLTDAYLIEILTRYSFDRTPFAGQYSLLARLQTAHGNSVSHLLSPLYDVSVPVNDNDFQIEDNRLTSVRLLGPDQQPIEKLPVIKLNPWQKCSNPDEHQLFWLNSFHPAGTTKSASLLIDQRTLTLGLVASYHLPQKFPSYAEITRGLDYYDTKNMLDTYNAIVSVMGATMHKIHPFMVSETYLYNQMGLKPQSENR